MYGDAANPITTPQGGTASIDRGAFCNFFAYEFSLPLALIIMSYFLLPGKNSRFYIALFWEAVATALGIAAYTAFHKQNMTPTQIGYSILVLIIVNLFVSIVDVILKFRRPIHTFHLLLAHACLWVGVIATVFWWRDYTYFNGYRTWATDSFIAMWGGAMIAIVFPPLIDYIFFYRGYLVPDDDLVRETKVTTSAPEGETDAGAVNLHPRK